ncbi:heavy metal translocating P-type ATPase, partial [Bacillus haikouensis]|uniref:heavy metal translocating P-type ATPase n=1 Tax=Bacillus haikouensis TaxID=1510468 RepID=UPI001556BE73
ILAPSEAWIKAGSQLIKKPVEEVNVGEILVVKPGDKIPLDGEIVTGESSVNQAPITGESIPVDKQVGDTVYAGTISENGSLEVKVTKLVEDTTIAKIIHLVEEAQEQKAPTQAFIDKFAGIYTPIVFVLALVVMVIPPIIGFGTWGEWFYKGLELLVVACPCALVISTPVAIVSAIGNAAKNGVLIKGGTFLEKAGAINAIAFDKTGTLTEGKPNVSEIRAMSITEDELLSIALTLEDYSTHPIAQTIVRYANKKGIQPKQGELFKSIVGKGVQATIDKEVYFAGNARLFDEMEIPLGDAKVTVEDLQIKGKTVVIIGTKEKVLGVISVADTIRAATVQALNGLKKAGVNQIVMLTGDNEGTAKMISKETSVNRYFAELLPEDKVEAIKQLQSEGHNVAMVGDGINDAPALATADLGIAMGGAGTDTAMETADIVLMADNLEKLPHTINLSRKALDIIKQNIWFSLIVKFVALALIFPGWLTLWLAVLSDTGAAIIVILNALRLLKVK